MPDVLGLDIGGANLKAAHSLGQAVTRPFPLWRSPERLTDQLRALIAALPPHEVLAVTMTGELCDCFASKSEGVRVILATVETIATAPLRVWTTAGRFQAPSAIRADPRSAAAANWLALAHLAARRANAGPALLLDTGSTTTDLVYLDQGLPQPRGRTDFERMRRGELVYTGVRRTPVCAVLGMAVAAELFATMLDVYLLLGEWPEDAADTDTADGRPATREHAHARLARLYCADADELCLDAVTTLARQARDAQTAYLVRAVDRVLADRPPPTSIVLSGSGEIVGRAVRASHPLLASLPAISLAERLGPALSEAAAAYAVALLAREEACRHA